ncbi:MAG TPA: outer membrane beta-barrel protein [Gemmatimonadales bacterium]|nr:outer membrane beta-barrel protein [Gemmatimonadales bacterium]
MSIKRLLCVPAFGLMLAGLATLVPSRAIAQNGHESSTSLSVWAAMSSPLGSDRSASLIGSSIDRRNSFAGGARLTFWGSNILGVEAVAGLTPAKVEAAGSDINESRRLDVFAGGVKLMIGLSPSMSPVGFHVGAGPAIVRRNHYGLDQSTSKTNLGGLFGAGFRFPINQTLGFRLDVEDYVYGGSIEGKGKTQNDLITSAGLTIRF